MPRRYSEKDDTAIFKDPEKSDGCFSKRAQCQECTPLQFLDVNKGFPKPAGVRFGQGILHR